MDIKRSGQMYWTPVETGDLYCVGDAIRTVVLLNTHDKMRSIWQIISLEAQNLIDEEFNFQSENIRTDFAIAKENTQVTRPTDPRFIPNCSIFLRMTFNF